MSKSYIRYANDLFKQTMIEWDRKTLLETVLDKPTIPHYMSVFKYTPEQMEQYLKTKSAAGMSGHSTNSIIFDFDDKLNVEAALIDTRNMYLLLEELGYQKNDIQIYFSGHKGFHLVIDLEQQLEQSQLKNFVNNLRSKGTFNSFDTKVYDVQRMFRAPFSLNKSTGLFKTPISKHQLFNASLDEIKEQSKNILDSSINIVESYNYSAPLLGGKELLEPPVPVKPPKMAEIEIIGEDRPDFTQKTKELTEAKYALQMGFFEDGERNEAFEILAATYKYLGYPKEFAHRMLKATDELYVKRMQNKGIHKELKPKKAIWTENINHVYGPLYKGGTYSEKDNELLQKTIQRYNIKQRESTHLDPTGIFDLGGDTFKKYAQSFYESRIYTGLKDLDEAFPICAGSNIGIVGASGAGKTSVTLGILHEMKKTNAPSVFASLDMSRSRLYEKLLYKVTQGKYDRDFLYKEYLNGNGAKYDAMVKEEYPNVFIYSKSAANVHEIGDYIKNVEQHTGKAVRLLMIDYFERLGSSKSDDTAASKEVAMGIQDLISDFPMLTPITLLQPNKMSLGGGPETPILSYTNIKGSSALYQSLRQILSLWRPFCGPEYREWDKFMEMAILKNDLGDLDMFKYAWEGKTGNISMLTDEGKRKYDEYMAAKKQMDKEDEDDGNNNGKYNW